MVVLSSLENAFFMVTKFQEKPKPNRILFVLFFKKRLLEGNRHCGQLPLTRIGRDRKMGRVVRKGEQGYNPSGIFFRQASVVVYSCCLIRYERARRGDCESGLRWLAAADINSRR